MTHRIPSSGVPGVALLGMAVGASPSQAASYWVSARPVTDTQFGVRRDRNRVEIGYPMSPSLTGILNAAGYTQGGCHDRGSARVSEMSDTITMPGCRRHRSSTPTEHSISRVMRCASQGHHTGALRGLFNPMSAEMTAVLTGHETEGNILHDMRTRLRSAVITAAVFVMPVAFTPAAHGSSAVFPSSQQVAGVLDGTWSGPNTYKPDYVSTDRCQPPYWRAGSSRVASYRGSSLDGYRRSASVTRVTYKSISSAKSRFAAVKRWATACRTYSYYGGTTDMQALKAAKVGARSVAVREWICGYEGGTQCDHATAIIARVGNNIVETRYSLGNDATSDDPSFTVNVPKTVKLARMTT